MPSERRDGAEGPESHSAFTCGADGVHAASGRVVGCCYRCGLLLCEAHVYHLRFQLDFGRTAGGRVKPLVCGDHAPPLLARAGMPPAEGPEGEGRGGPGRRKRPRRRPRRPV